MTDVNVNLAIQSICSLRRAQMLTNVPPSRIELEASPYVSGYRKIDLDMRRKAEILKYQNASLKTNSFTKRQQFSRLVKGQVAPISTSFLIRNSSNSLEKFFIIFDLFLNNFKVLNR
jgi:hypothetical protein